MKLISVITPCYNEEENIEELYKQIKAVFQGLSIYRYEHIFIDNASTDNTVPLIKAIAQHDKNIKLIVNSRNFGHIRSPYYGFLQGQGDATIIMASDLQDPPSMIKDFVQKWEQGFKIAVAVKPESQEPNLVFFIRKSYYHFLTNISEVNLIRNFTGFGLYDKSVVEILRRMDDPYPYFRGMISEIGFEIAEIPFNQPRRERGISKSNLYTLYDVAMLGITSHSKLPLRLATMMGFGLSFLSLLISLVYLSYKLLFWDTFQVGIAPLTIGLFFFFSVQLFFIGLLGEYIAMIHTQVIRRPLVIEKERINFDNTNAS